MLSCGDTRAADMFMQCVGMKHLAQQAKQTAQASLQKAWLVLPSPPSTTMQRGPDMQAQQMEQEAEEKEQEEKQAD